MKKILIVCLLAASCGTTHPPATVRVEIPIPVPCNVQKIDIPSFAVDALTYDSDIWDQMAALRAERLQRQAYEKILQAAIDACRK